MTPDHYLIHGDGLTEARAQLRKNLARLDSVVERGFSVGDAEPLSKMSVYDLRDLAEKLGADKKKLYGTSKQALIIIIDQLRANSARGDAGMSPKAKKIIDDYMKELDKQKANGVSTSPELVAAMVKGIMEANPITAGDAGKYVTTSISQAHKWGETFASQGKSWDEVAAILKAEGTDKLTVQRIKQAFEEQVARG